MSKKSKNEKCVYCLKVTESITNDHVLPKGWYPETTPPYLEKWTVPSCSQCNRDYGKIEEDLLIRLGLCIDRKDKRALGIPEKSLRAINSVHGKNEKDRRAREQKRQKLLRESVTFKFPPEKGLLPNFGPKPEIDSYGYDLEGVKIYADHLCKFAEKIVRGITYLVHGLFIEDTHEISIYFLEDRDAKEIVDMIDQYGIHYHRRPGILVRRAVVPADRVSGLYAIEVWGLLKMYAAVTPRKQLVNPPRSRQPRGD